MNAVLLDTNVLFELVRARPDGRVAAFLGSLDAPLLSALTILELTYGVERAADPVRREALLTWIGTIGVRFRGRIVDVDDTAGRLRASAEARGRPADVVDALIAASALLRGVAVATRNVRDFEPLGVGVIDPWEA